MENVEPAKKKERKIPGVSTEPFMLPEV